MDAITMKILLTCPYFNFPTDVPMYVHNCAVELVKKGHEVTILSEVGGEIRNSAELNGVRCIDFSNIFDIQDETFDVINAHGKQYAELALEYFDVPCLYHGEVLLHKNVVRKDPIDIGVDTAKFNTKNAERIKEIKQEAGQTKKITLFVGPITKQNEQIIKRLSKEEELWIVGANQLSHALPEHIKIHNETFFIEKWLEMADEVCGTSLYMRHNAFACGKPFRQFTTDNEGNILSEELLEPTEVQPLNIDEYERTIESIK